MEKGCRWNVGIQQQRLTRDALTGFPSRQAHEWKNKRSSADASTATLGGLSSRARGNSPALAEHSMANIVSVPPLGAAVGTGGEGGAGGHSARWVIILASRESSSVDAGMERGTRSVKSKFRRSRINMVAVAGAMVASLKIENYSWK